MSGRKEHDQLIQDKIQDFLKDKPKYLVNYYDTLWKKTATTKRQYLYDVWRFLEYIKREYNVNINHARDVSYVKPTVIETYLGYIDVKNVTKARIYYSIRNFYDFFVKDDKIVNNPCNKIEPPRDNEIHEVTYLTEDEIHLLLRNVKNSAQPNKYGEPQNKWYLRDYLFLVLALSTGMRVSSILEINLRDIDYKEKYIRIVQKGNKELNVRISDEILDVIDAWIDEQEYLLGITRYKDAPLFCGSRGNRWDETSVNRMIKKYTFNIDKKITAHKLRATCATNIIKKTGNIYLASQRLGHSNVETTKRYATIDEEMEQKAVDAMDSVLFDL